jgi:Tol biopolymer transport system component
VGVIVHALQTMVTTEHAPQLAGGVLRGWTSDGSLIYHGMDMKGRPGIFEVSVRDDATTAIALASDGFFSLPSSSNDGRLLVYRHQTTSGGAMVLLDRTTKQSRTLLADRPFGLFAMAPDGKSVAFVEPLQEPRSLNLLTIATGAIQRISSVTGSETISSFEWLPDSRRLVTWTTSGNARSGFVVPLDGGAPVRLDPSVPGGFAIHPDGRRIAFTSGQRKIEVWMLQNFLPAVSNQSAR